MEGILLSPKNRHLKEPGCRVLLATPLVLNGIELLIMSHGFGSVGFLQICALFYDYKYIVLLWIYGLLDYGFMDFNFSVRQRAMLRQVR